MTLPFSSIRKYVILFAFLILAGGIGYNLGQRKAGVSVTGDKRIVINQESAKDTTPVDFSLFWDVWQRMFRYYIDAAGLDTQKMVWGAISGMVASAGDPYTVFLPPKENKDVKEDLAGEFEGIGAQLGMKDSRIIVIAPLKGTPAERAGIKPGDYILKVDDVDTVGWTVPQAVTKIRGVGGTSVKLNILHDNSQKPVDMTITRQTILVPSVESWVKKVREITEISGTADAAKLDASKMVAYIRLSRFGDHSNEDWDKTVAEILDKQRTNGPLAGLIFDLRNNPGGYLDGSVFIASEFIKSGVVVSQKNSDGTKQDYPVDKKGKLLDIPLVVLVNRGSASAAEIVAGALRDYKRATIVGETTFGKGSVQTPQELRGGAGLHITTGKWLLPKGETIAKVGVKPDIEVKLDDAYTATTDAQLAKAVEVLLK
ncbi:MAG: S41 family peptidase [Candidatus Gottesmanbacteria bacterium]|nr:S41 family peptidase [Candidatus Gottesmanbacteria bacterium]